MGPSLQSLEDQYMLLTQQLPTTLAACTTQAQKDQVTAQYVDSRHNYWNSIQKAFHDDDPTILSLVQQMHDEQKKIKDSAKQLNNIAQVINIITDAVTVGTALAAKAGLFPS
jgi:DNA repair ATPase RecN